MQDRHHPASSELEESGAHATEGAAPRPRENGRRRRRGRGRESAARKAATLKVIVQW